MKIIWDETKRESNIAKHGLDFADIDIVFFHGAIVAQSHSHRFKAIGRFRDGTVAVVFATLGTEAISLVSMRAASKRERMLYEQDQ